MCTHCRQIFNPYSRRLVLVKCGKCDACKQERAAKRSVRIRNNASDGTVALFITLTYSNNYVPYVKRSDLATSELEVNIYRNNDVRYVFDRHSNKTRLKYDYGVRPIDRAYVPTEIRCSRDYDCPKIYRLSSLVPLNGLGKDYIGVPYYPDIQDFYKRLRQYLIRDYHYDKSFSYFTCSELGGHSYRPHFHALLFIARSDEATFRSAIVKAWPYADRRRTAKFIEIAKNAASYVSAYVNCGSDLPALFEEPMFKPKHSSSKNFGCTLDCFSLAKVLEKIDSGDLAYYCRKKFDGQTNVYRLPLPKYILYRYFPVCKGFGWLTPCQLRAILLDPQKVGDILTDVQIKCNYDRVIYEYNESYNRFSPCMLLHNNIYINRQGKLANPLYHFSPKETYQIYVRLENCYQRFHFETGLSRFDYVFYYERVWSMYNSMLLKMMHEDLQDDPSFIDYSDFYENNYEVIDNPAIAPTLNNLHNLTIDPNMRIDVVNKTNNLRSLFSRLCKQKQVTNYSMVQMGYEV